MQCNIDARGKAVRLVGGLAGLGLAVLLAAVVLLNGLNAGWWWAIGLIAAFGAFGVFEGWKGWCALRALGFRTKL